MVSSCDAGPKSAACLSAITEALKAAEYLRDPTDPFIDPLSVLPGGYADMAIRLKDGRFGGLSNQDLATAVYAERLKIISLLSEYSDSVQAALGSEVHKAIVNAALTVLTFGISEKLQGLKPAQSITIDGTGRTYSNVSIDNKISSQLTERGWTAQGIRDVINHPPVGTSIDKRSATKTFDGLPRDDTATVYGTNKGYVVVNDRTGEIVQISDRRPNSGWINDSRIKWN